MLRLLKMLRLRVADADRGMALVMVLGIGTVLFILAAAALTVSVSSSTKSRTDEDWNGALAAAYAGVADYQSRLVNDNTYQRFGDPAAPFSQGALSSLSLPTGALTNPAFGSGAAGSWATVPGGAGTSSYRYEVNNSDYATNGVLRIRSTGRVGNQTRSVVANLRQKGFIDFLYFTVYETQDPAIAGTSRSSCEKFWPARRDSDCGGAIQFGSSEVLNGPVHSNDALYICGGTFNYAVTSSYSQAPYYRDCGNPQFNGGIPAPAEALNMPPTNLELRNETRADLTGGDVPRPGCLYTGPTRIVFHDNGTMTVRSPWTKWVNIRENPVGGVANGLCGTPGNVANGLGSPTGATIPVLLQNLAYVQAIPASLTDPNSWAPGVSPSGFSCSIDGNGLGYPLDSATMRETQVSTPRGNAYYGCGAGDVFVEGKVKGQMTVAAENYIWVTGDLTYSDSGSDILGLVGQNAVWVWNPYGQNQTCVGSTCTLSGVQRTLLTDAGREIDAAILSVQHTFQVQNYDKGSARGDLTVMGAIAQKFRGTVGTTAPTGYTKKYNYDPRFRNIAPPKFLSPVSTTYGISQYAEVKSAFTAAGVPVP
jgi:hypothetical protein